MDDELWAEGDIVTLTYEPWFGLRTPGGVHEPEDSAPAWGQLRNHFFANPIACDDYDTSCTLRVVRGNFAPRPDDDGNSDPVDWTWVQPGIFNGIGSAGERLSMYVQPSYFYAQLRLVDTDGSALQVSSNVTARFTKRQQDGVVYEGETLRDVLDRHFQYQFTPAQAILDFGDANPAYVGFGIDDEVPPGPVVIPQAEPIVESGSPTSNLIEQALRIGTYDVTLTDNSGRLFAPLVLQVTDHNIDQTVMAEPDPLVVTAVRAPERVPVEPFSVEVDVMNVSAQEVTMVRPSVIPQVLPAGGPGVQPTTPAAVDLPAGDRHTFQIAMDPQQGGIAVLRTTATGRFDGVFVRSDEVVREVRLGEGDLVAMFRLSADDSELGEPFVDAGTPGIRVVPGDLVLAELILFNSGDVPLHDVRPGPLQAAVGLSHSGPDPSTAASLAPGTGTQFDYLISADSGGVHEISVEASGRSDDGDVSADATGRIDVAGLRLELLSAPDDLAVGEFGTVQVRVSTDEVPLLDVVVNQPTQVGGDGAFIADPSVTVGALATSQVVDLVIRRVAPGAIDYEVVATATPDTDAYDSPDYDGPYLFDDLTAKVASDLGRSDLQLTDVEIEPSPADVGAPFELHATVANTGTDDLGDVMVQVTETPDDLARLVADGGAVDLAAGATETVTLEFLGEATGTLALTAVASGSGPGGTVSSAPVETSVEIGEPAIGIDLSGQRLLSPSSIEVIASITNLTGADITDIVWTDGGLQTEHVAPAEAIRQTSGPSPLLPSELEGGQSVMVRWIYDVVEAGTSVVLLQGQGESDGAPAKGNGALSVEVSDREAEAADLDRLARQGIEQMFTTMVDTLDAIAPAAVAEIEQSAGEVFTQERYDAYRQQGFSDWGARQLATLDLRQAEWDAYWAGYGTSFKNQIATRGSQAWGNAGKLWATVRDPVARNEMVNRIVESGQENLGYLGQAILTPGPEALEVAVEANAQLVDDMAVALDEAWIGQQELWEINADAYAANPIAFRGEQGGRHGMYNANGVWDAGVGVAGELGTAGAGRVITAATSRLTTGLRGLRTVETIVEEGAHLERVGDASGAAAHRVAAAEVAARETFQDLPYGQSLDAATLERLGGFSTTDAARIQDIIADARTEFGVDLEIVARTADPASAALPGVVGKQEYMKFKANGVLDQSLGAPSITAGQVTVFEPRPLAPDVLEAIEIDNPGFRTRYQERLETQQDYWEEWNSGNSRMNRLVEGSATHDGITVINARPGAPTHGVEFLEQLDDPSWLSANSISTERAAELKIELASHPGRVRANIVTQQFNDATVFFQRNADQSLSPIGSDYDLQGVRPAGGAPWPPGRRGQIETWVKQRIDQIDRSGRHGWSDSAFDLPSEYFELAAKYQLGTALPAAADDLALELSRRFGRLADRIELQAVIDPDLERGARLLAQAEGLRELTPAELLRRYPPGEKTIVFTSGDIRVGSGTGGT